MINYLKANFDSGMNNLLWYIESPQSKQLCLIDPGYEKEIKQLIEQHPYSVSSILITHHHWDHTNAVPWLLEHNPKLPIYGPANSPFSLINQPLRQDDHIKVLQGEYTFRIIETPGHTLDHLCFHEPFHHFCFVGDTVFAAGVGRLFEGTPQQFYRSIEKIKQLPNHTQLYVGHDYLYPNMKFAQKVEPSNANIKQRYKRAKQQQNFIQSTIADEKQTNPFFRTNQSEIQANCERLESQKLSNEIDVFASLRRLR